MRAYKTLFIVDRCISQLQTGRAYIAVLSTTVYKKMFLLTSRSQRVQSSHLIATDSTGGKVVTSAIAHHIFLRRNYVFVAHTSDACPLAY